MFYFNVIKPRNLKLYTLSTLIIEMCQNFYVFFLQLALYMNIEKELIIIHSLFNIYLKKNYATDEF